MEYIIEKFIDEKTIEAQVKKIAESIIKDYEEELTLVTILEGAKTFASDLMKKLYEIKPGLKIKNYSVKLSSYRDKTVSSGKITVKKDVNESIKSKDVIIVEDIVDTGNTLHFFKNYLIDNKKVRSVKVCALLDKPSRRKVEVSIDYKGMEIPNKFVVGYGIDYAEKHRELPYIGIVKFKEE